MAVQVGVLGEVTSDVVEACKRLLGQLSWSAALLD